MAGYQSGIGKFEGMETQVFGVSTDNTPSQRVFAEQLKLTFPILSDFGRKMSAEYGVLNDRGMSNRTTFVIDKEGIIQYVEEGNSAVSTTGAEQACSRVSKK